ncbi:MAG: hypothetical protein HY246_05170 [Proteobacteria bacterium]|nr:hypothetical protein [Pseudomonadota bacterium]
MKHEADESSEGPATPAQGSSGRKETVTTLRKEVDRLKQLSNRAMAVSIVAGAIAVSSPLWSPPLVAVLGGSDPATVRMFVLAVEQLKPALASSAPFERQITVVRRVMADDREVIRALDQIAAAAPVGVVRVASAMRLHDLARALELTTASPTSALLAEAAHRLANDDLAGAVKAMERLPAPYAPLAAPWLASAKTRLTAGRVLEMLDSLATARMQVAFRR